MPGKTELRPRPLGLLLAALVAGCVSAPLEVRDPIELYFREGDLEALTRQELALYPDAEPGESERLERAFPGAPPQIPHAVEDMLPITGGSNECLDCHEAKETAGEGDVPLSDSHFERPLIAEGPTEQGMLSVVRGYERRAGVAGSRYQCVMCHAPQATNVRTPASRFVREPETP